MTTTAEYHKFTNGVGTLSPGTQDMATIIAAYNLQSQVHGGGGTQIGYSCCRVSQIH